MSSGAPNPYAAVGLDPDLIDADAAIQYESEIMICRRAFSTAQSFLGLFSGVDSTHTDVGLLWHGSAVDVNEGSFAVVQSGSRLAGLVGEIVRVTVKPRTVYAYVVAESPTIPTELSLARRAFLAIGDLAQDKGLRAKVEVMV